MQSMSAHIIYLQYHNLKTLIIYRHIVVGNLYFTNDTLSLFKLNNYTLISKVDSIERKQLSL